MRKTDIINGEMEYCAKASVNHTAYKWMPSSVSSSRTGQTQFVFVFERISNTAVFKRLSKEATRLLCLFGFDFRAVFK